MSVTAIGDRDGQTTFANVTCCGIESAQKFARDVRIHANGVQVPVTRGSSGWSARHEPKATLTISYRLPPSGPTVIDAGIEAQLRPLIHKGLFHLLGTTALLLPTGHAATERVELDIDATRVARRDQFVSSFGPGNRLRQVAATRSQLVKGLYLGGPIALTLHDTPSGKLGVVYSAMDAAVRANDLRKDSLAIIETERKFFNDGQPWYLVSIHGGLRNNPEIHLGGGMGRTNAFVMYVRRDLDFSNAEHREQFRWVLAHEYFHQWNGLTLRVASIPKSDDDDTSVYWFSEGVTEFYTMRLLTRAGLQSPARSLDVLNDKLRRYAKNSKRAVSAWEAGRLFWTDPDGEQIPYLRGYLAAWSADIAMRNSPTATRNLDSLLKTLVKRAKAEPRFRVDNRFLASRLSEGLSASDATGLRRFIIDGGDAPLLATSFGACLVGKKEPIDGQPVLQFHFSAKATASCFQH